MPPDPTHPSRSLCRQLVNFGSCKKKEKRDPLFTAARIELDSNGLVLDSALQNLSVGIWGGQRQYILAYPVLRFGVHTVILAQTDIRERRQPEVTISELRTTTRTENSLFFSVRHVNQCAFDCNAEMLLPVDFRESKTSVQPSKGDLWSLPGWACSRLSGGGKQENNRGRWGRMGRDSPALPPQSSPTLFFLSASESLEQAIPGSVPAYT